MSPKIKDPTAMTAAKITPEEVLKLMRKAKFKRAGLAEEPAFPGIQSKKAAIAYVGDDATMIIDYSDLHGEWLLHISFNDLIPERTFRLQELK